MHFLILAHRGYIEVPNNRLIEGLACFFFLFIHIMDHLWGNAHASVRDCLDRSIRTQTLLTGRG